MGCFTILPSPLVVRTQTVIEFSRSLQMSTLDEILRLLKNNYYIPYIEKVHYIPNDIIVSYLYT